MINLRNIEMKKVIKVKVIKIEMSVYNTLFI